MESAGAGLGVGAHAVVDDDRRLTTSTSRFTYPANTNVLVSLGSFGVSGIYLSFLLTVIASMIARSRGWVATVASRCTSTMSSRRLAPNGRHTFS